MTSDGFNLLTFPIHLPLWTSYGHAPQNLEVKKQGSRITFHSNGAIQEVVLRH